MKMSDSKRLRVVNDIGCGLSGAPGNFIKDFRVYEESGSVQVWFETEQREYLQYLSASEAMAFAAAFERCAIAALRSCAAIV